MGKLKVVVFSADGDTGGQGYRIKRAFDRHIPEISVRSVHSNDYYFNYPADLTVEYTFLHELFANADVLHLRNGFAGYKRYGKGQPVVLHHHGSAFRQAHRRLADEAIALGARQIASTVDLTLLEPNVEWVPAPYNISELFKYQKAAGIARTEEDEKVIRIAHAPTNRTIKSTTRIMSVVAALAAKGFPVTFDLIERVPWEECLRRKAKADIFIDQLILGYGNNAIEAWGMNIPVISGIKDGAAKEAMIERFGGRLPFYSATEATLEQRLVELIEDKVLRNHWAAIGHKHLVDYHDEEKVAYLLSYIYKAAAASRQERVS